MWTLVPLNDDEFAVRLLVGHQYVIGRRDCDIPIPNDMSISRRHAVITLVYAESDISDVLRIPKMQIKDISKFGTLLRNERIANDSQRFINSGDILEFGTAGQSRYRCIYEPLVVTISCLDHSAKRLVKQQAWILGGHVVGEWTSKCMLVIMTNLSVTVKVICALVSLKHIVIPQFLVDMVSACKARTKLPDPNDYLPPLAESQVNSSEISFRPSPQRQSLFTGKRFYFLSTSQLTKLRAVIELAGGEVVSCNNDSLLSDTEVIAEHACIIWSDVLPELDPKKYTWIQHVQQLLTRSAKRMILESEIGFAVLYCSTARYCNPSAIAETNAATPLPMPIPSLSVSQQLSQHQHTIPSLEKISRVDEDCQRVAVANQMRPNGSKCAVNFQHQMDVTDTVVSTDNNGSSVTGVGKQSVKIDVSNDNRQKEVEYPSSMMIGSSFVANTLVLDISQGEESDVNMFNNSSSAKKVQVNSECADVDCQLQISDIEHQLHHTSQQIEDNAHLAEHEQTSVKAMASSCINDSSNVVSQQTKCMKEVQLDSAVIVEEHNLIKQRSSTTEVSVISTHVTWQGQRVKNFKKFRRNSKFTGLPRCIGGRDLVTYEALTHQQKEWIQNGLATESETQNMDKLSQELFNWEPAKRRKN